MKQKVFTNAYIRSLRNNIDAKAYAGDSFDLSEAKFKEMRYLESCKGLADKMVLPPSQNNVREADYKSAIAVYETLKGLTPLDASLPNIWVTLNHTELFSYMKQRRLDNQADKEAAIKTHFIGASDGKNVMRLGVAGFWWNVYLTVDETREDPYELTKILFGSTDFRTLRFGELGLIRYRPAMIGVLEFLKEHPEVREKYDARGQYISKFFSMLGGHVHLDFMDKDYFKQILESRLDDMMKIESTDDVQNHPELFVEGM